jgi:hypothetical protein
MHFSASVLTKIAFGGVACALGLLIIQLVSRDKGSVMPHDSLLLPGEKAQPSALETTKPISSDSKREFANPISQEHDQPPAQPANTAPSSEERREIYTVSQLGSTSASKTMISDEDAVALARRAISGVADVPSDAKTRVISRDGIATVFFLNDLPPGTLGSDFHVKVELDSTTGQTIRILGGD